MAYQSQSDHRWMPPMDAFETDSAYTVCLEIPGVNKRDLRLSFQDDTLTISGERQREQDAPNMAFLRMEIDYGEFRREVRFPEKIQREAVKASYQEGFLKVVLPKS
jgi:HSP20 family protein